MIVWVLLLLAIPFVLSQRRIRSRLDLLEETVETQHLTIDSLERQLRSLTEPKKDRPAVAPPTAASDRRRRA